MKQPIDPQQPESIFKEEELSMEGYDKHIRNARKMLFIVAGLNLIGLAAFIPVDDSVKLVAVAFVVLIAAIFVLLAVWTKKRPYTALLTALIFYSVLQVLGAILQPSSIFQGWIWKIIIIVLLINGLRNGKESQNMMDALGKNK